MTSSEEKKYWVAFSNIERIGPQKFKLLYEHFPKLKTAWQASYSELKNAGLTNKDIVAILEKRTAINPDEEWKNLVKNNIGVITVKDSQYPKLLKEIHSPPALLYINGDLPNDLGFTLAVVGTRKTTPYGRQITPDIVDGLTQAGLTIISGLALGIDTLAHQAALSAGGRTIAVLGCGLDIIYPYSNESVAQEIIKNKGCIISEYPIGTKPLKQHFPARNRIISGLSKGVLVIEGNEDSGSLITAKCALEQNREILAVPGNISSTTSHGPNNLIKMGAYVVTSANDVLEALDLELAEQFIANKKIIPGTKEEEALLKFLSSEPLHIDEIIKKSKLSSSIVNSTLTIMEMKGIVRHMGGMHYILAK